MLSDHRLAVDVEERAAAPTSTSSSPIQRHRVPGLLDVRHQVAVGEHHALHQAGGAARDTGSTARSSGSIPSTSLRRARPGSTPRRRTPRRRRSGASRRSSPPGGRSPPGVSSGFIGVTTRAGAQDRRGRRSPTRRCSGRPGRPRRPCRSPCAWSAGGDRVHLRGELGVGGHLAGGAVDERRMVAARGRAAHHVLGHGEIRDLDVRLWAAVDQSLTPRSGAYSRFPNASAAIPPNIASSASTAPIRAAVP